MSLTIINFEKMRRLMLDKYPVIALNFALIFSVIAARYCGKTIQNNIVFSIIIITILIASYIFIEFKIHYKKLLKSSLLILIAFCFFIIYNSGKMEYKTTVEHNGRYEIEKIFTRKQNYISSIIKSEITNVKYLANIKTKECMQEGYSFDVISKQSQYKLEKPIIPFAGGFYNYLYSHNVRDQINLDSIKVRNKNLSLDKSIKAFLIERIDSSKISPKHKSIVKALVLGDKKSIDEDLLDMFSDIGVMHLLALSGLHLGVLSYLINLLLGLIFTNGPAPVKAILNTSLLVFYAFIVGFPPSISRAVLMFSIININANINREYNLINSLSIASFFILLINPFQVFNIGFQLSFSAVLSIAIFNPFFNRILKSRFKIVNYFLSLTSISLATQIGTMAISIYYFNKFSLSFLMSNLILIPAFSIVLILSFIFLSMASANFYFDILENFIDGILHNSLVIARFLSSFDNFIFDKIVISDLQLISFLLFLVCLVLILMQEKFKYEVFLLSLIVFLADQIVLNDLKNKDEILIYKSNVMIRQRDKSLIYLSAEYNLFEKYLIRLGKSYTNAEKAIGKLNEKYIFKPSDKYNNNPIDTDHIILIDRKNRLNPLKIVNRHTKCIIFLPKEKYLKERWKTAAMKKGLKFIE
jgi:competence protein ComEC